MCTYKFKNSNELYRDGVLMNNYDVLLGQIWNTGEKIITIKGDDVEVRYFVQQDFVKGHIKSHKISCQYIPALIYIKNQDILDVFTLIKHFAVLYGGL